MTLFKCNRLCNSTFDWNFNWCAMEMCTNPATGRYQTFCLLTGKGAGFLLKNLIAELFLVLTLGQHCAPSLLSTRLMLPIPGENPHPVGIQSFWRKRLTQVAQLGQGLEVPPDLPPQTPLLRTVYTMDWELCAWIQFRVNISLPHTGASTTSEQGRKILLTCIFPKASLRSTQ